MAWRRSPGSPAGARAAWRGGAGAEPPAPACGFQVCSSYLLQRGTDSGEILARLRASACQVGQPRAPGLGDAGARPRRPEQASGRAGTGAAALPSASERAGQRPRPGLC